MPRPFLSFFLTLSLATFTSAASPADNPPPPEPALVQRADKIVAALNLSDPDQVTRVRDLITRQYQALRLVHATRDNGLQLAKSKTNQTEMNADQADIRDAASARQADLHYAFVAALAVELTPAQVDQIKDGMTYGVLPLTFRVYQEMLPDLTAEQRKQILAWLSEAREHAMDASSSEEKHAWFGKYKGRINNYLSKAGIDMKQAEKDLQARRKAAAK